MHRVLNLHQLYAFMVSCRICLPLPNIYLLLLFFHRATAPCGSGSPHYGGFTITLSYTHCTRQDVSGWVTSLSQRPQLTAPNTHKNRHSYLEPAIPVSEWPHTNALERVATGIDLFFTVWNVILNCSIKCLLTHIMINFYLKTLSRLNF
jgi:hypothetical protein